MSGAFAEYLAALEVRDAREHIHAEYVNAYTKLADRTASSTASPVPSTEETARSPSPGLSTRILRPGTPKSKPGTPVNEASPPSSVAQLRLELASTQRIRGNLETQLSTLNADLATLKTTSAAQAKRIENLERTKLALERRGKDRAEELKGKGRFVEEVQDEMVALNLQLNMAEQEKEKLRKENEELTKRWVRKMEEEARSMNDRMGFEDGGKGKGKKESRGGQHSDIGNPEFKK